MCGIAGKYYLDHSQHVTTAMLRAMTDAIAHRGPDDEGNETFGHVGLAQRRLAIIDLSPLGHQPMSYAKQRYWMTFNGEIYNYQELRALLLEKGYRFSSHSDTEIMLAMYQEFGEHCVKYFNGMFAFAIYDKLEDVLFAARDRMGEKPFKYFFDGKTFVFASELKAILTQSEVPKTLDDEAIRRSIYWGFVPAPYTGYTHIRKLPAAHTLTIRKGKLHIKRYWDVPNHIDDSITIDAAAKKIRALLYDSVRLRMIADVPVGAFLSGGIDSCIVTGLMSQISTQNVKSFTIGIKGWKDNESDLAQISARQHHTDHSTLFVTADVQKLLPTLVRAYEEPFGDTSAIPSYKVAQATRKHVTVALNGDGGDENFCGYSNYHTLMHQQQFSFLQPLAALGYQALSPLQPLLWHNALYQRGLRISDLMKDSLMQNYARHFRSYLNLINWNDLFVGEAVNPLSELTAYLPKDTTDPVAAVTWADLHNVLPDGLMPKMDIASMQHALETRAPFLDHRLIEYTATLPTTMKYHHGESKWILKYACRDLIPEVVRTSPKRGFVMPVGEWLRTDLSGLLHRELADPQSPVFQYVRYLTVQKMLHYHRQANIDYSPMLWRLLTLNLWLKNDE